MPRPVREIPQLITRDGVFVATWYDIGERRTKRFSLRTRSADEAQARFAAFLVEGRDLRRPTTRHLTVSDAIDDYLTEHVRKKLGGKPREESTAVQVKAFFKGLPLKDVGVERCESYAEWRRSDGASDNTVRREIATLRAAAHHARRWKRISPTDMPTFVMPQEMLRADRGQTPWLTKEEVHRLFTEADGELWRFIRIAYWTGARRAAVETLRVEQFNWNVGLVNLHKAGERVTKKRKPIIRIPKQVAPLLKQMCDEAVDGWLFHNRYAGGFYPGFNALCRKLGFGADRAFPHILRHSRVTHRLLAGESIYKVARSIGDTVKTVERVYGHWSAEYMEEHGGRV